MPGGVGRADVPTNSVFCLMFFNDTATTEIYTKGHTMPRPFFGRCRAPSTCKAGEDGPGLVPTERWRQCALCWALRTLPRSPM